VKRRGKGVRAVPGAGAKNGSKNSEKRGLLRGKRGKGSPGVFVFILSLGGGGEKVEKEGGKGKNDKPLTTGARREKVKDWPLFCQSEGGQKPE